jgi:hypothetical protein
MLRLQTKEGKISHQLLNEIGDTFRSGNGQSEALNIQTHVVLIPKMCEGLP